MTVSKNKMILINLRLLIKKITSEQNKNGNQIPDWINFKYIIFQACKIRKQIERDYGTRSGLLFRLYKFTCGVLLFNLEQI